MATTTATTKKIFVCHHHQSFHLSGLQDRGGIRRCHQQPRMDGNFARTDRDKRPTAASQWSVLRDSQPGCYRGDQVATGYPMKEQYGRDRSRGRAQRQQLQTKCKGQAERGANRPTTSIKGGIELCCRLAGKPAHNWRTSRSPVLKPWEGGWAVHPLREAGSERQNSM